MASVVRLAFLTTMDYLDITYSGVPFILMSVVEPSLAVTLACVPLLRPLLGNHATRYSASGTREHVASLSPVVLSGSNSTAAPSTRRKRGRSSVLTVPPQVLQYHYEMGLCSKEDMPIDIQELMLRTRNDYTYQAEVTGGGHESDESLKARTNNSEDFEITPVDGGNILVKQEWCVSNEVNTSPV